MFAFVLVLELLVLCLLVSVSEGSGGLLSVDGAGF